MARSFRTAITAVNHIRRKNHAAAKAAPVVDPTQTAWGSITFPANPLANATITLGGTVVTFGTNVAVGGTLATTMASLLAFLKASADANISKCNYTITGGVLGIRTKAVNVTNYTIAASAATVSHSPLQLPKISARIKL